MTLNQTMICHTHTSGFKLQLYIHNGNWTEWSPIQSVIMQVMAKSDDQEAGVQFVNYGYDY